MKRLLLLCTVLLSAVGVKAEQWNPVGNATWQEGILTKSWFYSGKGQTKWSVVVEQSNERPYMFRMQPYLNVSSFDDGKYDYFYINVKNASRVYTEPFRARVDFGPSSAVDYRNITFSQKCPEKGYDVNYYGSIEGNTLTFPSGAFEINYTGGGIFYISNKPHVIVFDEGVLDHVPATETWVNIGKGKWNGQSADVEKSADRAERFRIYPFEADETGGEKPAVIVNAANPDKVYVENYVTGGMEYSQKVPENGWATGLSYGKMQDGVITIDMKKFQVRPASGGDWTTWTGDNSKLTITLPEGYAGTPNTSGVYFGITAFNYEPEMMPISLLSQANKNEYKQFINDKDSADATYLYYSVDVAIQALAGRSYPEDLNSVALITFTDGNDDGSLEKADPSWSDVDYQNYLVTRIRDARVQGLPIDAYSIGLKGLDIGDYNDDLFRSNLRALASSPENASEVNDMDELENTINQILDNLEKSWDNEKLALSINMRATGDTLRFTLDKGREEMENNPDNSELWVEGVFSRTDNSLNEIVYHGFTSSSGSKVVAEKMVDDRKTKYVFTFENLRDTLGNVLKVDNINFWHKTVGNPKWQPPHTEFKQGKDTSLETARTSAAIMFVMDCSSSLGDDFTRLQQVAASLVDRLAPGDGNADGINDKPARVDDGKAQYYNLQGMRVERPTRGVYILRQGNQSRKVVVK